MKTTLKALLVASALGLGVVGAASPAAAYRHSSVSIYFNTGDVAIGYRDGYYDRWHRWHRWHRDYDRDYYRHHYYNRYHDWDYGNHYGWDRGRHYGWRHHHRDWDRDRDHDRW